MQPTVGRRPAPVAVVHVHPDPDAEAKVSPGGNGSVTVIGPGLVDGPRFETASEYVPFLPRMNDPVWLFTIDKSEEAASVVGSLVVLFEVFGSAVCPGTTVAVFVKMPVSAGSTLEG